MDLKKFNHHNHMYIAWQYLKMLPFEAALERYARYLRPLLDAAGQSHKFNLALTRSYLVLIERAMQSCPTDTFEELVEKRPSVLKKLQA